MQAQRAGTISPKILDRLQELGFSPIQNLLELIDNAIDASAKNIWIIVDKVLDIHAIDTEKVIYQLYIVDDGTGMSLKQHQKYYDLAEDKDYTDSANKFSIGSKGMGGKIATINLSNKGKAGVITRYANKLWSESEVDWGNKDYINSIIVNPKPSVDESTRVKRIFQDILQIPEPTSFTIINICMDTVIHSKIFNQDVELDAETNYKAIIGMTYFKKLEAGLQIRVIQSVEPNIFQSESIVPIPLALSNEIGIKFPDRIVPIVDTKQAGCPDYTSYYRQTIYNFDRKYRMYFDPITNKTVLFELDQQNNPVYEYTGSNKNKKVCNLKFKARLDVLETTRADILKEYKDFHKLDFALYHRHLTDLPGFKRHLTETYKINITEDSHFVQDSFYGTHLIRNGKVIQSPVIKFNEITAGDFFKRNWTKSQFIIEANIDNNVIDKQFGIMVNKSTVDEKNVNPCIFKLINHLTDEIKTEFTKDHTDKLGAFESNKATPEPVLAPVAPKPVQAPAPDPVIQKPVQAPAPDPIVQKTVHAPVPVPPPVDISDEKKLLKTRKPLSYAEKERIKQRQHNLENHTQVKFSEIYRYDIDHKDNNPANNADDNLQAISPNLHALKTYNNPEYLKVVNKPHIYNINMALAYLQSGAVHLNTPKDLSKQILSFVNILSEYVATDTN